MFDSKHHEFPHRHHGHEHHEAVLYIDEAVPKVTPDVLHARRGDHIIFSAVNASFRLELPDIFTVSIIGRFRVRQNENLQLVVRDNADYGVYHYGMDRELPLSPVDPTIIIHNGQNKG